MVLLPFFVISIGFYLGKFLYIKIPRCITEAEKLHVAIVLKSTRLTNYELVNFLQYIHDLATRTNCLSFYLFPINYCVCTDIKLLAGKSVTQMKVSSRSIHHPVSRKLQL